VAAVASDVVDSGVGSTIGAAAVSSGTTEAAVSSVGVLGDALVGAGGELVGDVAGMVGDAVLDGVSTVGSAVADAAVGVATDAAIGTGVTWGVWDGIQRMIPPWLLSGGAAVLGGEVLFAILAFSIASSALDSDGSSDDAMDGEMLEDNYDTRLTSTASSTLEQETPINNLSSQSSTQTMTDYPDGMLVDEDLNTTSNVYIDDVMAQVDEALAEAERALQSTPEGNNNNP